MVEDEIIFSSDDIAISKTMAVFGGTSYPVANIGAVSIDDNPSIWYLLVVFGIVALLYAFFGEPESVFNTMVFGIGSIVVGGFMGNWLSTKKLMLRTSSGNEQAFESRDEAKVIQIKSAIETAVSQRG